MRFRIACIGVGGYAQNYVRVAQALHDEGITDLVAVAEAYPDRYADVLAGLAAAGTRVYSSLDDLVTHSRDIDLITIGTGLHFHYPMAIRALEAGYHVLLAKPSTVLIQHADRMIEAAGRAQRLLAVDFQHIYSEGAQAIKQAIATNQLGRVRTVVARCVWCRTDRYYTRNNWAGRFILDGRYVLDGPMNNPHAHYITNSLYFCSSERYGYATPIDVQAELYRAHAIEGEDTACVRAHTDTGAEILFLSTLSGEGGINRTDIDVYADHGTAHWSFDRYRISPEQGRHVDRATSKARTEQTFRHVLHCLETGERPLVTIEDTRNHVLFTNGAYESCGTIHDLPRAYVKTEPLDGGDISTSISGINQIIDTAGERRRLFSEMGLPWAKPSPVCDVRHYTEFTMRLT